MGTYLSTPNKEKISLDGDYENLVYGASEMQGWRKSMEDAHIVNPTLYESCSLFSVFDGHGGKEVALFAEKYFGAELVELDSFKTGDYSNALVNGYYRIDELLRDERHAEELELLKEKQTGTVANESSETVEAEETKPQVDGQPSPQPNAQSKKEELELQVKGKLEEAETRGSLSKDEAIELMSKMLKLKKLGGPAGSNLLTDAGCTAVSVLKVKDVLYTANAGDSRAVISRAGKVFALSSDHKPLNKTERDRIEAAGGKVGADSRINGNLNLSRALGDLKYKQNESLDRAQQMITAQADVTVYELNDQDQFFILACDGVWDILSNQGIVDFVAEQLLAGVRKVSTIIENIFERCICQDPVAQGGLGGDNMTCIIVFLKPLEQVAEELRQETTDGI